MSNKILIYTCNLPFSPRTMDDVINFAKSENKFRIASVELNPYLADVQPGDNIVTNRGNSLYVIKAYDRSLDQLTDNEADYIDDLQREYGLKKVGITSVANVIKFHTWCKSARIINTKNTTKMNKNSIKGISERIREMFMPTEATDVRIATDGNICVATDQGYVSINENNELVSYVDELTLEVPVFIMSKPKDKLVVGDIIALPRSYAKVIKIGDGKITAIGYTGTGKNIYPIKDFLIGQSMVRVVVSILANAGAAINPMLLMAMSSKGDKNSFLPLLMMSQQGGNMNMNPLFLLMLADKGDSAFDMKDIMMLSAIGGNNVFGNLFQNLQLGQTVKENPKVEVTKENPQPKNSEMNDLWDKNED